MKKKSLLLCSALTLLSVSALAGCGSGSTEKESDTIVVWVGSESVDYYQYLANQYLAENPEFGYKISIIGADTGGAASLMVADNTSCGDIVTIAHDNIGKLSQLTYIVPIVDSGEESKALLDQIEADNPAGFKTVIKNILGSDQEHTYTFAAPYISQALFLYYDTRYVSDEQADSFEGLLEAARAYDATYKPATPVKSYTVTGKDGFNFSFPILARNITNGNTSTLRLYENGGNKSQKEIRYDSYAQANEQIAVLRWMQRNIADPNGGLLNSDSPWATNIEQHVALSCIGGAWHFNSFKKAVTDKDNKVHMGCKIIPTFTLTAEDVEGIEEVHYSNDEYLPTELKGKVDPAPAANTVMRGGTFVDCKCFVINAAKMFNAHRYYNLCKLIKYFSTKSAQNASFLEAGNVPAYAGSEQYIEEVKDQIDAEQYLMARAQTGMNIYGIPQPFVTGALNTYYYSKNAPDYYYNAIVNTKNSSGVGEYDTVDSLRKVLFRMEYVWKHGSSPNAAKYPTSYPEETSSTRK